MNRAAPKAPVTTTVSGLSDRQLQQRLKELTAVEHQLEVVVIDHLRELERRRLYLSWGFSSLFDYATRELGYSEAAAWRRIKAMRLCGEVEGARERLQDGSLTLNSAALLQNAFDRQERKRKQSGSGRGARNGVRSAATSNGSAPNPDALNGSGLGAPAQAGEQADEPPTAPVLDSSARQALVKQAAGKSTRQVENLLAGVDPELTAPADRIRPLGAGRWELKAVVDDECRRGLEQLKGLLSHVDPHMTLGQIVERAVREAVERHDPARPPRGRRTGSRPASSGADETSAPKEASGPDAASAQRNAAPTGGASETSAAKDATGTNSVAATARPAAVSAGATTSPVKAQADSEHRGASAGKQPGVPTLPSAPKVGGRRRQAAPSQSQVRGRAIPAAVRRQVWERDRGCCSYVDRGSGRRCGSRNLLQIDHIIPFALGGSADPDNLRLLCAAHHRHRHATRHDPARPPRGRRTGSRPAASGTDETSPPKDASGRTPRRTYTARATAAKRPAYRPDVHGMMPPVQARPG